MDHFFQNRQGLVLVVEPSNALRTMYVDILRNQGFAKVQGLSCLKDVVSTVEIQKVSWVIAPIAIDQPVSIIHLLRLFSEHSSLRDIRTTVFFDAHESKYIPTLMELGAVHCLPRPTQRAEFENELKSFFALLETFQWNTTHSSAEFLFHYLIQNALFKSSMDLCDALIKTYPSDVHFFLLLVKAHSMGGNQEQAKTLLRQAKCLHPNSESKIDELSQSLFNEILTNDQGQSYGFEYLGLNVCIIIDPDEASRKTISDALNTMGTKEVVEFEDGESAWNWIINLKHPPSLVIYEWRIPGINASILTQKIKHRFPTTNLLIVSSLLKREDFPFIREMGITTVVTKPTELPELVGHCLRMLQNLSVPDDIKCLEQNIRRLIKQGDLGQALKLKEDCINNEKISKQSRTKILAEISYALSNYQESCELAIDALKYEQDSIFMLNLLGKSLFKLGDFEAALKCLQKAQNLSPQNIERLCLIAETNLCLERIEEAEANIEQAHTLDPDHDRVKEAKASLEMSKDNIKRAKEIIAELDSAPEFFAFINNKSVILAKAGKLSQSLDLYRRILDTMPDDFLSIKSVVIYNFSLALAKEGDYQEAIKVIALYPENSRDNLNAKVKSLTKKLKQSLKDNMAIRLNETQFSLDSDNGGSSKKANTPKIHGLDSVLEARPGDLCCYLIFDNPEAKYPEIQKIIDNPLKFKARKSITRNEPSGLKRIAS